MSPQVTIITATYNRSKLLRYAIQSVLWQTLTDFEMLVVGDGCTDDSEQVVASFGDGRLHWHNLPENSGGQSVPNNYGLAHARSDYVAYLGHDDLWYPTHLELLVRALDTHHADLAHSLCVMIGWEGVRVATGFANDSLETPTQRFTPPSSVMHRRDLVESVGNWRAYRSIDQPPDLEFFERVRAAGKQIVTVPELTCFKFPSAWRPNSYREDFSAEQAEYARRIQEQPDFLYRELIAIARAYALGKTQPPPRESSYNPTIKPHGWRVEQWRLLRGLAPKPMPRPTLRQYLDYLGYRARQIKHRLRRS